MYCYFRYLVIMVCRTCLRVIHILPVRVNRITFCSYNGLNVSCNPLYIYNYITEHKPGRYECYWVIQKNANRSTDKQIRYVYYGSLRYYIIMLTSQIVITNNRLPSIIPFRKKQYLINTWHGGGLYKRVFPSDDFYTRRMNILHMRQTSLYLSSSKSFTEYVIRKTFAYDGEVLNSGMPRNDLLFQKNVDYIYEKIRALYNIPQGCSILLYAPTFRGHHKSGNIDALLSNPLDIEKIKEAWMSVTKKECCFLFRGHHALQTVNLNSASYIDVTSYPDMQELLAVADVLITDYSSCMWDFSLTYKPIFLYAPDFELYESNPGFESDWRKWPFVKTLSNEELYSAIISFDIDQYRERTKAYHDLYGSYERGNACEMVAKKINSAIH